MLPAERPQFSLRDYLRVIRRRRWTIVAAVVIAAGTAIGTSTLQTKIYEGRAEVLLQARGGTEELLRGSVSVTRIQTEIRVLRSAPVRDAVRKRLGTAPQVNAAPIPETDLFHVWARSPKPNEAALIANTYVEEYISYRRKQAVDDLLATSNEVQKQIDNLQKQIDQITNQISAAAGPRATSLEQNFGSRRDALVTQQAVYRERLDQLRVDASLRTGGAQLVTPAVANSSPIYPTPKRNGVIGIGLGLLIGMGLALLFEHLDDTIKVKDDLERAAPGIGVVGLIPAITSWRRRGEPIVISQVDPGSHAAEAYRTIRTSVSFLSLDHPLRTLQITSPSASDGKSTTLANLAVTLSRAGQRVIIVCCDLRRPRIHEFFGLTHDIGFTSVLLGDTSVSEALQTVPSEDNLWLLASGPLPPNPSELLSSNRTLEVLEALKARADIVLLDCPPVLPVTDAAVISSRVDATLLVATEGKTTKREVARALELLRQVNAPIIGTILNGATGDADPYGYAYLYRLPEDRSRRSRRRQRQANREALLEQADPTPKQRKPAKAR